MPFFKTGALNRSAISPQIVAPALPQGSFLDANSIWSQQFTALAYAVFKPTARRVPLDGVLPLSFTLDSAGPIAKTVTDCALLDQVLAAEDKGVPTPANLRGLRLAVPSTVFQNELSPAVADSFRTALTRLSTAGATVVELPMAEFAQAAAVNPRGALTGAEAYSWHRPWMKDGADKYDPRVIVRIRPGETMLLRSRR